jgi:hypothetical protein
MFGANVAELHLAHALLEESQALQWDIWSNEVLPSLTKTHDSRQHPPDASVLTCIIHEGTASGCWEREIAAKMLAAA